MPYLLTQLCQKQAITLLECDSLSVTSSEPCPSSVWPCAVFVPRVLVVWRKSGRVCGFGDFGAGDFLEGIDALASGVESVHEMHGDGGAREVFRYWRPELL